MLAEISFVSDERIATVLNVGFGSIAPIEKGSRATSAPAASVFFFVLLIVSLILYVIIRGCHPSVIVTVLYVLRKSTKELRRKPASREGS
jgi:hypothetical protein